MQGAPHFYARNPVKRKEMRDLNIERAVTERICRYAGSPVLRILLFGSRATGTAKPHSDYDLLVVEEDPVEDWWAEEETLCGAVAGLGVPVDIHVMGKAEFLETREVPGSISYPAHQTGVILYERSQAGEGRDRQSMDRIGPAGSRTRGAGP
jgi:predicted nucleotidyltransferase